MNKLERIAVLYLTFLGHPGGLSFAKIREYLPEAYNSNPGEDPESVRRKFERDKEELRSLGMDLRHHAAGEALPDGTLAPASIYIVADELHKLPEVELTRSEVHALAAILMAALAESAETERADSETKNTNTGDAARSPEAGEYALLESAAYKLLYKHPALLHNRAADATEPRPTPWRESAPDVTENLARIHEALSRRRTLAIDYTNKTGRSERRQIDGRGLISHRGRWCLVAFCHRAQDVRMFYVDRIAAAELTDREYRAAPKFDIQKYSLHPLALLIEPALEVRVRADPDREEVLLDFLNGAPATLNIRQSTVNESPGRNMTEITLETTNPSALFGWMVSHPGTIQSLGPDAVYERFIAYLDALKRNYHNDAEAAS